MELSADHVMPEPAQDLVTPLLKVATEWPMDTSQDLYAQSELERRHRRIELIIEKARRLL
jgi:hypothetical protein